MTAAVLTDTQVISQLSSGIYWSTNTATFVPAPVITFDITTLFPAADANHPEFSGATGLNVTQTAAAILTVNLWDDLIATNFKQVASGAGDIAFGNSTYLNTAAVNAYAYTSSFYYLNGTQKTMGEADLWFNTNKSVTPQGAATPNNGDLNLPVVGNYSFHAFLHEFGHALGLNHMGDYNGTANATTQASGFQDSTLYSIMSYFGPNHDNGTNSPLNGYGVVAWANWTVAGKTYSPQTPMMNDILAIQAIYGISTTTRAGDTVYGFNSNITGTEAAIYNFNQNAHPILCLFDSSGRDTLDLSGYSTSSRIDLHAGAFSDAGGMTNNISIAKNTIIEVAIGGSGADIIIGNDAGNTLIGGGGADTITGGAGDDLIIGGAGADTINGGGGNNTASYAGSAAGVTVDLHLATAQVSAGDASGDILTNIKSLIGSTFDDILTGAVTNAFIDGGAGNDAIIDSAGYSIMTGGSGNDTFIFTAANLGVGKNDVVTDYTRDARGVGDQIAVVGINSANVSVSTLGADQAIVSYGTAGNTGTVSLMNLNSQTGSLFVVDGYTTTTNAITHNLAGGFVYTKDSYNVSQTWTTKLDKFDAAAVLMSTDTNNRDGTHTNIIFDDMNTQSYASITSVYNGALLQSQNTLNHNSSHVSVIYDYTAIAWSSIRDDYDTQNRHSFETVNLDGGNYYSLSYEVTGLLSYSWVNDYYNSSHQQTDHVINYRDGNTTIVNYDITGQLNWADVTTTYNSNHQLTLFAQDYRLGGGFSTNYDYTAGITWSSVRDDYNTAGKLYNHAIIYDDGSKDTVTYDLNNLSWAQVSDHVSQNGFLQTHSIFYDDNSLAIVSYNAAPSGSWATIENDYNAMHQLTNAVVTYSNNSVDYITYDYLNQFSWNEQHIVYDGQHHLSNQYFV